MATNVSQTPPTNDADHGAPVRTKRERDSAERRAAILTAAREVFFERGLYRATVDEIAARAEIAKGTVYLYFPSKETILAHVLIEGLSQLNETLSAAYAEDRDLDVESRLRNLADAYLRFFLDNPTYLELMMASDRGNFRDAVDGVAYASVLDHSLQGLHKLVKVIQAGIAQGAFAEGSAEEKAAMVWSAVNGVLVLYSHPLRREMLTADVTTLYHGVLDMVLDGLRKS